MKNNDNQLCLQSILLSFSKAIDLMHPELNKHHIHVGYIAYRIANLLGYNKDHIQDVVIAALLHDIGAFSGNERINISIFEDQSYANINLHAEVGYRLLRNFIPLSKASHYIRYHHKPWKSIQAQDKQITEIPIESHIIHIADRIAVLINKNQNILEQISNIQQRIIDYKNVFAPELIEICMELSIKESFWLDILYDSIDKTFCNELNLKFIPFCSEQLESLVELFRRIIDFRSRFTATHSSGVAATASTIAKIAGFSPEDVHKMKLAGYLHDLGKIVIPTEILESPNTLTSQEISIMRTHPYYTHIILKPVPYFDTIRIWGSQHHERVDGKGYPFHIGNADLSLGSRIMMVADIFTALAEDRPYRKGLPTSEILNMMQVLIKKHVIDADVYDFLCNNVDEINYIRTVAQDNSKLEYQNFLKP
jgi:HD-GYP domain-containing protein (c-di-GMP phosphodiesterase class II)